MLVRVAFMICMALSFLLAGTARAAETKMPEKISAIDNPVIAVLDVQQVLRRAAATKGLHAAMAARRKAFEAEIAAAREDLQAQEQKFRRQSTILSPEAINEERRALETQVSDLRRMAEQRRGTLNRAFTGAKRKLRQEIAEVLAVLMKERKITITLARKAVLVFDQRLNVTEEVLKRLDKSLPDVTVDFEKPGQK